MANFSVESKKIDPSFFVVKTRGYFDELGGNKFKEVVKQLIQAGGKKFLFNFKETPIINSNGISYLLEILDQISYDVHGESYFCSLSKAISDVFRMTGISNAFKVFENEEQALTILGQSAEK